jgi:hypothetical protein
VRPRRRRPDRHAIRAITRFAAAGLLVLGLFTLAGCGSEKKIDTPTLLSVLHRNGFRNLYVVYGLKQAAAQAKRLGQPLNKVMDADAIYTRPLVNHSPLLMPIVAGRLPSAYEARFRIGNDKPLFNGTLSITDRAALPRGFHVRRLREVRVCNVVLDSYDAGTDPTLRRRFDRVVALLHDRC